MGRGAYFPSPSGLVATPLWSARAYATHPRNFYDTSRKSGEKRLPRPAALFYYLSRQEGEIATLADRKDSLSETKYRGGIRNPSQLIPTKFPNTHFGYPYPRVHVGEVIELIELIDARAVTEVTSVCGIWDVGEEDMRAVS